MPAKRCVHDIIKHHCKACSPKNFCEHAKRKTRCIDCKGGSYCEHNKIRSRCIECGGGEMCIHGKRKSECKECEGNSFCKHQRIRSQCKECAFTGEGGGSVCIHNQLKTGCRECGGGSFCAHRKRRSLCSECPDGGSDLCLHKKQKGACTECNPNCNRKRTARNFASCIVQASKKSDKKRNRRFKEEEYVSCRWIHEQLEMQYSRCVYCCCKMLFGEGMSRKDPDGLTIERIDEKVAHIKENCVLACSLCNNRSYFLPKQIMNDGRFGPNLKEGIFRWCPGKAHGANEEDHVRAKEDFGKNIDLCIFCAKLYSKERRRKKQEKKQKINH